MQIKPTLFATTLVALLGGVVAHAGTPATATRQGVLDFAFDSSVLPANATDELDRVIQLATEHPDLLVVLDGHTDPVGTETYNIGLSLRRSEAVRAKLIALGFDPNRMVVTGYGKDGPTRATYAADRRVTIWTTTDSITSVVDRTFARSGTAVRWNKPMTTAQLDMPADASARR